MLGGLKPALPKLRCYSVACPADNSSYSVAQSSTVRINVPYMANSVIDTQNSYLKMTINVAGNDMVLDPSAYSLIRTLQVSSQNGGNVLETINFHNILAACLLATTLDNTIQYSSASCLMGVSESNPRVGATIVANGSLTVCLPLISILGTFSEKALPAVGFRLDLGLEDIVNCFYATALGTATLTDVSYVASVIDLGPAIYNALFMGAGGVVQIPASSWRGFEASVSSSSSSQSFQVGARQSSLKGLLATMRRATISGGGSSVAIGAKTISDMQSLGNLTSWQIQFGSELLPPSPVVGYAQSFAELMKSFHALGTQAPSQITLSTYSRNTTFTTTTPNSVGAHMLGYDFEQASRNKSQVLLSGANSMLGQNIFLSINWASPPASGTIDVFMHYDLVLQFAGQNVTASG